MNEFFGTTMSKLGFGLMRLPRLADGTTIDVAQCETMTDAFLDAGMRYFDTAYVYEGSEEAAKRVLVSRHPRESFLLADKINASPWAAKSAEEAKRELATSLERTGAGYFDFYLLHALSSRNVDYYEDYGIWDFVAKAKEQGLVRHMGFSFHDRPDVLDTILTSHPEAEFVQLQLNYGDWESPSVCSRENYEVAVAHGKPVIVMEPVKGGLLANPPQQVQDILRAANSSASIASWAVRFVASLENVMVVLSGMSNVAQMEDNLSYMREFTPLSATERDAVARASRALAAVEQVPCTGCHYCTGGCPQKIDIPSIFSAYNRYLVYGDLAGAKRNYESAVAKRGKASDCVRCLQCEGACPQHIEITSWLEKAAAVLE